jgi:predicted transcriptional regulator
VTEAISISSIRADGGTQMRSSIDPETVLRYSEHIRDGAEFPPITVFYDGKDYWLADGFHRCDAHLAAAQDFIPADIRSGSRIDAVVYALKANASNGRPRTTPDLQRAYRAAVDNNLCGPGDVVKVKDLIGCSDRWARELTKASRESAKVERNHKIADLSDQGMTQREIAADVGASQMTVSRIIDESKRNTSKKIQNEPKESPSLPKATKKPTAKKIESEAPKIIEALKNLSSCLHTPEQVYSSATDKQRAEIRAEIQRAFLFLKNLSKELQDVS